MPCSEGLTVKLHCQGGQALEAPYEELKGALGDQSQVSMAETPTKQAKQKAWLRLLRYSRYFQVGKPKPWTSF
ncbi:hypothetical protein N8766_06495 [bacterium]|nr:hypothetical protein [bacterium]